MDRLGPVSDFSAPQKFSSFRKSTAKPDCPFRMVALSEAPAPLNKYQSRAQHPLKSAVKRSRAPPAAMPSRAPKRPRPSDGALDADKPAAAIRKKEGMKAIGKKPVVLASDPSSSPNKALDGSSYRKGMFLAFIDDALAQRYKVGIECFISRSTLLPANTSRDF